MERLTQHSEGPYLSVCVVQGTEGWVLCMLATAPPPGYARTQHLLSVCVYMYVQVQICIQVHVGARGHCIFAHSPLKFFVTGFSLKTEFKLMG